MSLMLTLAIRLSLAALSAFSTEAIATSPRNALEHSRCSPTTWQADCIACWLRRPSPVSQNSRNKTIRRRCSMTDTIEIVLTGPLPNATADGLDAAFRVYRPFTTADQKEKLDKAAAEIRGVAAGVSHDHLNDAFFDRFPKLEILASCGVGYDHVDAKAAARRGIIVTNTPDVLNEEVADTALGL